MDNSNVKTSPDSQTSPNEHGRAVEPKVRLLMSKLANLKVDKQVFLYINSPWYTTPADFLLLKNSVDTMLQLTDALQANIKVFEESSRLIVEAKSHQ